MPELFVKPRLELTTFHISFTVSSFSPNAQCNSVNSGRSVVIIALLKKPVNDHGDGIKSSGKERRACEKGNQKAERERKLLISKYKFTEQVWGIKILKLLVPDHMQYFSFVIKLH